MKQLALMLKGKERPAMAISLEDATKDLETTNTALATQLRTIAHSMRHTFRTWLDSVGASVGVQQKLMRHAESDEHLR